MGWWVASEVPRLIWGDRPADRLGPVIDEIIEIFEEEYGRRPTRAELHRGLDFTMGPMNLHD